MFSFPERLKQLRIAKQVTQKEIAECLSVQVVTVQRYEYGDRLPKLDQLVALADYFNVSLDYLIGRSNSSKFIP